MGLLLMEQTIEAVNSVYDTEGGSTGCCLHILTDDENIRPKDARFCLEWAQRAKHPLCIRAAELLVQMSTTQRKKFYNLFWDQRRIGW